MNSKLLFLMLMAVWVSGCSGIRPQIIDPYSDGFSEDEYLVIKAKDQDQLGQLFEAIPEYGKDGKQLPLSWRQTTIMIFPAGAADVNKVKETKMEQTRQAIEKFKVSSKLTVVAIADLSASNESAYKYESKSSSVYRLDPASLGYTKKSQDYVKNRLAENKDYKFAYLSALYKGTAFVEVLTNVSASGSGGNQAAFQIGGEYFKSGGRSTVTSGPIIFQLSQIDKLELGLVPPPQNSTSLTQQLNRTQLREILSNTPAALKKMIE